MVNHKMKILKFVIHFFCIIVPVLCSLPVITEHPSSLVVGREEPATLRCQGEGQPPPDIVWFKNGVEVTTAPQDPSSHRVLLPAGSLFFLRVVQNRREDDTGTYWCVARNKDGETVSEKAELEIAFLKSMFVDEPLDAWVLVGEKIILPCSPPPGFPKPTVSWWRDGVQLNIDTESRLRTEDGSLIISMSKESDQGSYQCIASNIAGTRSSHKANLSVYVKPYFIKSPEKKSVDQGTPVDLVCLVGGDPPPDIRWTGPKGVLSYKGSLLQITQASKMDEGEYTCFAENIAGTLTGTAYIQVTNPPKITVGPNDQKVVEGGVMSMSCSVNSPETLLYWIKEKDDRLLESGPRQDHRKLRTQRAFFTKPEENQFYESGGKITHVLPDTQSGGNRFFKFEPNERTTPAGPRLVVEPTGELVIHNIQQSDEGYYYCLVISESGSSIAAGKLSLKSSTRMYPPIIELGPVNQTLYRNEDVKLNCQFTNKDPETRVVWLKDGLPIELVNNLHFSLVDGTNLLISGATEQDSAVYTCQLKTSSGQTSASASVTVLPKERGVKKPSSPDLLDFPASPGKPRLVGSTNTSIRVEWSKPVRVGKSPLRGYQVEYYISGEGNHWVLVIVQEESLVIEHLGPSSTLIFLVRARNEHGLSPPSLLSDPIKPNNGGNEEDNLQNLIQKLSMKQVEWSGVAVNSATQVTFKWNVVQNRKIIEGYHLYVWRVEGVEEEEKGLKVKDDKESDENIAGGQTENKEIITLSGGGTTSYTMKNLSPYTRYQAFILPFAKTAFGRPSVIISFTTKETVPVLPPSRLELKLVESSSAVASWKPPAEESIGGKLIGYKVEILTNGSQVGNLTLDPGSTSLMLNNLSSGYTYTLRIAAFNGAGVGPYSDEVTLKVEPSLLFSPALAPSGGFSRSIHETWFVSFIGTFSILSVLAAGFLVYIRRRSAARKHYAQYSVGESKTDNNSLTCMESDTLWINPKATGLSMYGSYHEKPTHLYINSVYPPEYAELQQTNQKINQGPTDKTFQDSNYLPQGPCYASTDLMEQSFNKTNGSGEERSSAEEQSQSTGETTSGSLSSRGKASVERREKPRRIKKSSHETSQQSVQCDGLISAFQQRQMLCYSVGNSPYRVYNRGLTAESNPLPLCDPGLPPMPPSRGPSSFHGVRVGSLNSFNGPSPGAIRYGSNFSVPGLVPGYPEYGGMLGRVYRGQEERGFDSQYESASIYQATHPTLNTENREESSLINHPNNICNIPTSTANSNNHYMSCGSEHSEMESFYADSSFEDTQTHHPVSNGVLTPSQPGVLAQEEQIYSTFKPPPLHNERVPKRRLRMERRLSDSQSRKLKGSIISLQERGSVSANCSPAPNRRCREEGIVHLSTRVSEDINEMVEQIQSIQNDISELAGRPISLTK